MKTSGNQFASGRATPFVFGATSLSVYSAFWLRISEFFNYYIQFCEKSDYGMWRKQLGMSHSSRCDFSTCVLELSFECLLACLLRFDCVYPSCRVVLLNYYCRIQFT